MRDMLRDYTIKSETGEEPFVELIEKNILKWFGYVKLMEKICFQGSKYHYEGRWGGEITKR